MHSFITVFRKPAGEIETNVFLSSPVYQAAAAAAALKHPGWLGAEVLPTGSKAPGLGYHLLGKNFKSFEFSDNCIMQMDTVIYNCYSCNSAGF